jgi:CRP/FNR family cyclic AMP-dependent transcriptional regulator
MTHRRSTVLPSTTGLRSITLLAGLSDETLRRVSRHCAWRLFSPAQRILSRDSSDNDVYLIVSGVVRVTAFSASGRQLIYRDLHRGQWFGDLAAIDHRLRSADVDAKSEALLASMHAADFKRLLSDERSASEAQIAHLIAWVRDLSERLFDVSTLGVQNRVDAEILRLAKASGVVGNVARIDPAPKHSDIASQVSTYREQVTREISHLAKQAIVDRDGRALVVQDVGRLERMVAEVRRTS